MLIFLYGQDSYRMHERVQRLRAAFETKYDPTGVNVQVIDLVRVQANTLHTSLLSNSLFATRRFIILQDVFGASKPNQQLLLDSLPKIDDLTIVVCTVSELPKSKAALKTALLAANTVEDYQLLSPLQVKQWLQRQLKQHQATITPDGLNYMLMALGNDLWAIHNVIEQLVQFNANITIEAVKQFVTSPLDDNIFHFTDALLQKNLKLALHYLHDQLTSGANALYLLTMLERQLVTLVQVKDTRGEGMKLHPYVVQKTLAQVQQFSLEQLHTLHNAILQLDHLFKSTKNDPAVLLDRFIVDWCQ